MKNLALALSAFVALATEGQSQVTVCYGQDNCQDVSSSGTVQWDEERARQKAIREAREHAWDARAACNLADDPERCRAAASELVDALVRKRQ